MLDLPPSCWPQFDDGSHINWVTMHCVKEAPVTQTQIIFNVKGFGDHSISPSEKRPWVAVDETKTETETEETWVDRAATSHQLSSVLMMMMMMVMMLMMVMMVMMVITLLDDDRDPDLAVISYESSVAFTLNNPTTRLHLKPTASSCCSLRLNKKAPEGEKTRDKA